MKLLDGRGRKTAVPFLCLSIVGWIIFIVAFGWRNRTVFGSDFGEAGEDRGRLHERWFSFWGFAVGAPVFYLLAFPHLIFGQWYIGIVSNLCATFILVAGGGALYINGDQIRAFNEGPFTITDAERGRLLIAEFAGCFIGVFFVALYIMTQPFYTDVNNYECVGCCKRNGDRGGVVKLSSELTGDSSSDGRRKSNMKLLDGRGRKVAVPFLLLSIVGWIVFIVGFGRLNAFFEDGFFGDDPGRVHPRWFPFWAFAVGAPVFYLLAFPHLIFGQWYIGIVSNFCATFILVAGGSALYIDGDAIREDSESFSVNDDTELGSLRAAEFVGCFLGVLFVVLFIMTQPFYTDVNNYKCAGYCERNGDHDGDTRPAFQPPSSNAGIAMQPVPTQQASPQGVDYPKIGAPPTSAPKE